MSMVVSDPAILGGALVFKATRYLCATCLITCWQVTALKIFWKTFQQFLLSKSVTCCNLIRAVSNRFEDLQPLASLMTDAVRQARMPPQSATAPS